MTHPLTNEECENLQLEVFSQTDRRLQQDSMRSGADWQLEQCIAWLESLGRCSDVAPPHRTHYRALARLMREAMRPQEES